MFKEKEAKKEGKSGEIVSGICKVGGQKKAPDRGGIDPRPIATAAKGGKRRRHRGGGSRGVKAFSQRHPPLSTAQVGGADVVEGLVICGGGRRG